MEEIIVWSNVNGVNSDGSLSFLQIFDTDCQQNLKFIVKSQSFSSVGCHIRRSDLTLT